MSHRLLNRRHPIVLRHAGAGRSKTEVDINIEEHFSDDPSTSFMTVHFARE